MHDADREPASTIRAAPTAHLLVGLPGAGKTTLARRLASRGSAVRLTLDEWMLRLHGLPYDHAEYGERARACRALIHDVAEDVLRSGADVVLDWSHWSRGQRADAKQRFEQGGWHVRVHYIDVDPAIAVAQAEQRTDPTSHRIDAEGVMHMVALLEPPTDREGIPISRYHHASDA